MTPRSQDAVIIGGGIVGLACAWALAQRGCSVAVVDRGDRGGTSRAALGILAPHSVDSPGALWDLSFASAAMYPSFVASLKEATGRVVPYQQAGRVVIATSDDEAEALWGRYAWQVGQGLPVRRIDGRELADLLPSLGAAGIAGLHFPGDHCVDVAALLDALEAAVQAHRNVRYVRGEATRLLVKGRRVEGVELQRDLLTTRWVVNAAGAWASQWGMPVRPVKGQAVVVRWQRLPLVVSCGRVSVAPAEDRLVVGSTVEEAGYDTRITVEAIQELLSTLMRLFPQARTADFEGARAGLRPTTPDGQPAIGRDTRVEGLVHATGHHRFGILLAPIKAQAVAQIITDGQLPPMVEGVAPVRFTS